MRGYVRFRLGDLEGARVDLDEAIRLEDDPQARSLRAGVRLALEDPVGARADLVQALASESRAESRRFLEGRLQAMDAGEVDDPATWDWRLGLRVDPSLEGPTGE